MGMELFSNNKCRIERELTIRNDIANNKGKVGATVENGLDEKRKNDVRLGRTVCYGYSDLPISLWQILKLRLFTDRRDCRPDVSLT